ncbi:protein C19orf12 homolog [Episyrphus balteatus]|uniref:protein C19orf12 homolog n=1 Tax=Episyrphus balteatus TaxID=286459 RepID=UPI002486C539|nr:protein C19orf12 homolog [Episyrphus balteatus]
MPINNRELMKAISIVSDNANVRVCVKQSGKGAMVCGAICLAGGLLLGPPGLAIGGTVGGLTAYKMSSGTFRPIGEILMNDLTERQQEQLVQHVQAAVADVGVSDLALLIPLLARNADIQTAVLRTVTSFVTNELRLQIID